MANHIDEWDGISVGVNRRNPELLAEVGRILDEEQPGIDAILSSYAVPNKQMNEHRERGAQ